MSLHERSRPAGGGSSEATAKSLRNRVRGRGLIALTATDVDEHGFITDAGVHRAWAAVVDTPAGSELEVDLGGTRHVSAQVAEMLSDAVRGGVFVTIAAAPSIQFRYVAAIRARLEQVIA